MTNRIFNLCVDLLVWLARLLGMSYESVNVWVFCVIWPIFTLMLIAIVVWQYFIIRKMRGTSDHG